MATMATTMTTTLTTTHIRAEGVLSNPAFPDDDDRSPQSSPPESSRQSATNTSPNTTTTTTTTQPPKKTSWADKAWEFCPKPIRPRKALQPSQPTTESAVEQPWRADANLPKIYPRWTSPAPSSTTTTIDPIPTTTTPWAVQLLPTSHPNTKALPFFMPLNLKNEHVAAETALWHEVIEGERKFRRRLWADVRRGCRVMGLKRGEWEGYRTGQEGEGKEGFVVDSDMKAKEFKNGRGNGEEGGLRVEEEREVESEGEEIEEIEEEEEDVVEEAVEEEEMEANEESSESSESRESENSSDDSDDGDETEEDFGGLAVDENGFPELCRWWARR